MMTVWRVRSQLRVGWNPARCFKRTFEMGNACTRRSLAVQMLRNADQFRQEAEQCRKLAESGASGPNKEAWLRLAADWIKLAESAEQRRRARRGSKVVSGYGSGKAPDAFERRSRS
jgi:hypothetical protein